jgi:hypothetical protein
MEICPTAHILLLPNQKWTLGVGIEADDIASGLGTASIQTKQKA